VWLEHAHHRARRKLRARSRMTSAAKIRANRRNALRSTGPRSRAGKAKPSEKRK